MSSDPAIDPGPAPEPEAADPGAEFPAGSVLAGRYRVLQVLGRGGMGSVYLGEHIEVGRKVAIKVLLARWSETESIVRRFRAEARTASAIGHPNIVQVFDAGMLPDKRLFLVMEHLGGCDLEDELIRATSFEPLRACTMMRQIALAVGAGHRAGVVHRDIKPSNIRLVPQPDGEAVKVLDFGIAANAGLVVGNGDRITSPGSLMGTPEYMAPEQATGLPARPTFDVYAMGVMLFELLTGDIPISASNPFELLAMKLNRAAPSIATRRRGLPPALVALVDECLATDPERRPADGDAVAARLDVILAEMRQQSQAQMRRATTPGEVIPDASLLAPLVGVPPRATLDRPGPASRRAIAPPLLLALLAVGGVALAAWLLGGERRPSAQLASAIPVEPAPVPQDISQPPPAPVEPEPVPKDTSPPIEPEPAPVEPQTSPPAEPAPTPPAGAGARPTAKPTARPANDAYLTPRCQRVRTSAEDARRSQRWSILRDYSRQRECWASAAEARKLETKALMELGDFTGCMSVGKGLKDQEAQGWLKLCQKRVGG